MDLLEAYKALADESRMRLLFTLSLGHFSVQELTSVLGISQSTVSHHLKVLQNAGLVDSRKEGTWAFYHVLSDNAHTPGGAVAANFLSLAKNSHSGQLKQTFESDAKEARRILSSRREHTHRYFETVAKDWKNIRKQTGIDDSFMSELVKIIPEEATLLELGCGSGALLDEVVPRRGKTIGVDYSQAMLDEARDVLGNRSAQVDLRLGYLEHLPLGDISVDIAVSYMVMHHLAAPIEAFKDICRVLKPGGELVIVDLVKHDDEFMRERYADLWLGFDIKAFERWLIDAGFSEPKTKFLDKDHKVFMTICSK
jgi:ubiquinone/menaquinone biosynthesis C-methylase UbiE